MNIDDLTETEVRALRAQVYGECTDDNWAATKHNWLQPVNRRFLQRKSTEPIPSAPTRTTQPATR